MIRKVSHQGTPEERLRRLEEAINFAETIDAVAACGTESTTPTGAPTNASYLVLGANGTLTAERIFTLTAADLTAIDSGPGAAYTLSLANTAVTAAAYGSASSVATFTVDAKGRLTAALSVPIAIAASAITSGTLTVAQGGTGRATSTTAYGLLAAGTTATGAHQTLAAGLTTELIVGGGASALPVWTTATGSGAPVRATDPTFTNKITLGGSNADLTVALTFYKYLTWMPSGVDITDALAILTAWHISGDITQTVASATSHKLIDIGTFEAFRYIQTAGTSMANMSAIAAKIRFEAATGVAITSKSQFTFVDETIYQRAGTGTIINIEHGGFWCNTAVETGCTAAFMRGLWYSDPDGSGTITAQAAVYVDDVTRATTNYSLYSAGAAVQMRHGGPVRIGALTAPAESLEVTGNATVSAYLRVPSIYGSHSSGAANLDFYANSTAWPTSTGLVRVYHPLHVFPGITANVGNNTVKTMTSFEGSTVTLDHAGSNIQAYVFRPTMSWTVGPILPLPLFLFVAQPAVTINTSMSLAAAGMCAFYNGPTVTVATGVTLTLPDSAGVRYGGFHDNPTLTRAGTGAFDAAATYNGFVSLLTVGGSTIAQRRGFFVIDGAGAGAITDQVAFDIPTFTKGTNNYGVRSAMALATGDWFLYASGTADSAITGQLRLGDTTAPTALLDIIGKLTISTAGLVTRYNNIATVSNGVPSILAQVNLTAQAAAITAGALYTPATTGMFRVSFAITLTRAATTSSILGAGVNLNYTTGDGATAVVQNIPLWIKAATTATVDIGDASNTIGTTLIGSVVVYASTAAMTYDVGYTSVGGTTMQYAVRVRVEAL